MVTIVGAWIGKRVVGREKWEPENWAREKLLWLVTHFSPCRTTHKHILGRILHVSLCGYMFYHFPERNAKETDLYAA